MIRKIVPAIVVIAVSLAWSVALSHILLTRLAPIGVPSGSYTIDLTYLVIIVAMLFLVSTIIVVLVKLYRISLLVAFKAIAIFILTFDVLMIYSLAVLPTIDLVLIVSLLGAFALTYAGVFGNTAVSSAAVLTYATMAGALVGYMLDTYSLAIFALVVSIFDVYTVYYGPLNKILQEMKSGGVRGEFHPAFKGLVVVVRPLTIGAGDIVFYSALSSHAYAVLNPLVCVAVCIAVILGFVLTIVVLLPRTGYAPALPLPTLLSLFVIFLATAFPLGT